KTRTETSDNPAGTDQRERSDKRSEHFEEDAAQRVIAAAAQPFFDPLAIDLRQMEQQARERAPVAVARQRRQMVCGVAFRVVVDLAPQRSHVATMTVPDERRRLVRDGIPGPQRPVEQL